MAWAADRGVGEVSSNPDVEVKEQRQAPDLLFIAGVTGRTGTNYLGRLLLDHPEVYRPTGHWELTLFEAAEEFHAFYDRYRSTRGDRVPFSYDDLDLAGSGTLRRGGGPGERALGIRSTSRI